jgi:hypothetical protein
MGLPPLGRDQKNENRLVQRDEKKGFLKEKREIT